MFCCWRNELVSEIYLIFKTIFDICHEKDLVYEGGISGSYSNRVKIIIGKWKRMSINSNTSGGKNVYNQQSISTTLLDLLHKLHWNQCQEWLDLAVKHIKTNKVTLHCREIDSKASSAQFISGNWNSSGTFSHNNSSFPPSFLHSVLLQFSKSFSEAVNTFFFLIDILRYWYDAFIPTDLQTCIYL